MTGISLLPFLLTLGLHAYSFHRPILKFSGRYGMGFTRGLLVGADFTQERRQQFVLAVRWFESRTGSDEAKPQLGFEGAILRSKWNSIFQGRPQSIRGLSHYFIMPISWLILPSAIPGLLWVCFLARHYERQRFSSEHHRKNESPVEIISDCMSTGQVLIQPRSSSAELRKRNEGR